MYDYKIINDFMLFFVKINATGFKVTGFIHTPPPQSCFVYILLYNTPYPIITYYSQEMNEILNTLVQIK